MSFDLTLATQDVVPPANSFKTPGMDAYFRPGNINRTADWLNIAPGQQLHLLRVDDFQVSRFEAEFADTLLSFIRVANLSRLKARPIEKRRTD